jgi:hypothetical protein
MIATLEHGDLLAPRRQERQVRKFNFFAAFAPLREIFRVLAATLLQRPMEFALFPTGVLPKAFLLAPIGLPAP